MVLGRNKCIICRKSTKRKHINTKKTIKYFSHIFSTWKVECSEAICDVLFGSKSDKLFKLFQNAEFCCSCQQTVRDIGFMWKQIQSFQNQIFQLSTEIRKNLNLNYQLIEEKSKPNVVRDRVSVFLETAESKKIPQYSYDDLVEIIYTGVLRHALNSQQSNDQIDLSPEEMEKKLNKQSENFKMHVTNKVEIVKQEVVEEDLNLEDIDWNIDKDMLTENRADEVDGDGTITPANGISTRKRNKRIKYESNDDDWDDIDSQFSNSDSSDVSFQSRTTKTRNFKPSKPRITQSGQKSSVGIVDERILTATKSGDESETRVNCTEATCQATFTTEQKMKLHVFRFHSGDRKPYQCTECGKRFSTKRVLTKHSRSHTFNRGRQKTVTYRCTFCGKKYLKEEDLTTHYSEAHQEPNPFTCAFCPEVYTNCVDLKRHTKIHRDPTLQCDVCGKSFSTKYTLKCHRKIHGDPSLLFSCSVCEKKYAARTLLNIHMKKHVETHIYQCDKCDKSFPRERNLEKHKIHHHNENGYPCEICGVMFTTLQRWTQHDMSHKNVTARKIKSSKTSGGYRHVCKFCAKGYNQEEEINAHYAVAHLGPNPFTCAFCPNIYSNSIDLQQHMKSEHPDPFANANEKKYPCELCDKVFITPYGLKNHSVIHKDPSLLFRCHLCPGVFLQSSSLTKHLRRHSEVKKCICQVCGKGFKDMDYLKSHMKIHLEKQFPCKLCDKKFTNAQHLKRHETVHSGVKAYICQACGKAFNQKGNMDAHYKQMHSEDPPPSTRSQNKQKKDTVHYEQTPFCEDYGQTTETTMNLTF